MYKWLRKKPRFGDFSEDGLVDEPYFDPHQHHGAGTFGRSSLLQKYDPYKAHDAAQDAESAAANS